MKKISFFSIQEYDKYFFEKIKEEFKENYEINYFKEKLTIKTAHLATGSKVVCIFVNDEANAQVIETLYQGGTELIALRCAGFNNVDMQAAKNKIKVVRVPAYSPPAVAEFALGLMLALNRKIVVASNRTKISNFSLNGLLGFDMHKKTFGIIGTGKIAKILIKMLSGFDAKVLAYDLYEDKEFAKQYNMTYTSLDYLFENSDVISLHCPLTPETTHIINARSISKMKKGVLLVNTARGLLVDTNALIDAIKAGKIGGAALDVYEKESDYYYYDHSNKTLKDDVLARLLSFKNVIITSHQAYFTYEALINIAKITFKNIDDYFEGNELVNEVK